MVEALDFTAKPTVLVVDDGADNLEVIAGLLKDLYRVKVANNGKTALQIARGANPPTLILLDIMMPEMSGYEVCKQLKADPATHDIPVIFLSALASTDDESKGLELGAEDYVTKPVNPAILRARLKTHVRLKAVADFLRDKSAYLEGELAKSRELQDIAASVRQLARSFESSGGGL